MQGSSPVTEIELLFPCDSASRAWLHGGEIVRMGPGTIIIASFLSKHLRRHPSQSSPFKHSELLCYSMWSCVARRATAMYDMELVSCCSPVALWFVHMSTASVICWTWPGTLISRICLLAARSFRLNLLDSSWSEVRTTSHGYVVIHTALSARSKTAN